MKYIKQLLIRLITIHQGDFLYDIGYILFYTTYAGKSSPEKHKTNKPYDETIIPLHGDAWFMPDWTRNEGIEMIKGRENHYEALMLMFGMEEIFNYSKSSTNG